VIYDKIKRELTTYINRISKKNIFFLFIYFTVLIVILNIVTTEFTDAYLAIKNYTKDFHYTTEQFHSFDSINPSYVFSFTEKNKILYLEWKYTPFMKNTLNIAITIFLCIILGISQKNIKNIFYNPKYIKINIKDLKNIFVIPLIIYFLYYCFLKIFFIKGVYKFEYKFELQYLFLILPLLIYLEEVIGRNIIFRYLNNNTKSFNAIILSGIIFSYSHFNVMNIYRKIYLLIGGIILSYIYKIYGLKWSFALHLTVNIFFYFFKYQVLSSTLI